MAFNRFRVVLQGVERTVFLLGILLWFEGCCLSLSINFQGFYRTLQDTWLKKKTTHNLCIGLFKCPAKFFFL